MFGSSVLPDLLETMKIVFARSSFASRALTCAGSVESRTRNSGYPGMFPKVSFRTSTQRLDPPMPRSTACLNPAARISSAIFWKRWRARNLFFDDAEPAEPLAFVRVGPERSIARPEALDLVVALPVLKRRLHGLREGLGQMIAHRVAEGPAAAFACFSTAARSLSNASANNLTPSSVS